MWDMLLPEVTGHAGATPQVWAASGSRGREDEAAEESLSQQGSLEGQAGGLSLSRAGGQERKEQEEGL